MGSLYEIDSSDGKSRYGLMKVGTTAEMLAYADMTTGSQWFDTTLNKVWTYSARELWMVVGECYIARWSQVGVLPVGALVVPTGDIFIDIADVSATDEIVGVNVWEINTEEEGTHVCIAYGGMWDVLCSDDSTYSVGDFLVHDGSPTAEDGQAKVRTTGNGHMAICYQAGSVAVGGGLRKCLVQTTERY